MKKTIIVSFVFFILALNSCSKSEEDKCKDKGKYWDTSTKECKEKAPGENGSGVTTTTSTTQNTVEIAEGETQESCKSKQGYVWSLDITQCKRVDYFMLIHSSDELYAAFVILKRDGVFDRQKEMRLSKGECFKLPKSYLPRLVIGTKSTRWSVLLPDRCNGSADLKCEIGIYTLVSLGDDDFSLQTVALDAERTDCHEFDDLEE